MATDKKSETFASSAGGHQARGIGVRALVQAIQQMEANVSSQDPEASLGPEWLWSRREDSVMKRKPLELCCTSHELIAELKNPDSQVDLNAYNKWHDALIHSIVKRKLKRSKLAIHSKEEKQEKLELLVSLLSYGDVDVDLPASDGMTALHFAVEACDYDSACALIAFGADVNVLDTYHKTPLDLIEGPGRFLHRKPSATLIDDAQLKRLDLSMDELPVRKTKMPFAECIASEYTRHPDAEKLITLLKSVGALRGRYMKENRQLQPVQCFLDIPAVKEGQKIDPSILPQKPAEQSDDWTSQLAARYMRLGSNIEQQLASIQVPFTQSPDEAISIATQMKELRMCEMAGSRILFLDGGGMRGLIEIEILKQIEKATGRRITELFDWIVGTSTGAVIAISMVYTNSTLHQIQQYYFKMKDGIFSGARAGVAYDTATREKILKQAFGNACLNDVKYPRVMIVAVNKTTVNLKLQFFNNCFDDELSTQPLWKVAMYTSAAPLFFHEADNYVDGGILANNPCGAGLTKIKQFYLNQGKKIPISLIVSVGSGISPEKEIGNIDVRDFLFFGMHWFNFQKMAERAGNLFTLLNNAMVHTEPVAEGMKVYCLEKNIPYYRFSPILDEVIPTREIDIHRLIKIILQAKQQIPQSRQFREMILRFHSLAAANRKMHEHVQKTLV